MKGAALMKATVLVDNIGDGLLAGEWGLSIYIEYGNKKILLDTGSSALFTENAKAIEIPLENIDFGILSHAHYDHAGGMEYFFKKNRNAKFYLQKSCAENCYAYEKGEFKYIGIPEHLLAACHDRLIYADGDVPLCGGVYLVAHKRKNREKIGKREQMYQKKNGAFIPDNFDHEQSLVLDTEKGLVIFSSCSHAGAADIINEVSETFPSKKVFALIGGFHLFNKTDEEVLAFAEQIKATGIKAIYTGHCTGGHAFSLLKEKLGTMAVQLKVGLSMEF